MRRGPKQSTWQQHLGSKAQNTLRKNTLRNVLETWAGSDQGSLSIGQLDRQTRRKVHYTNNTTPPFEDRVRQLACSSGELQAAVQAARARGTCKVWLLLRVRAIGLESRIEEQERALGIWRKAAPLPTARFAHTCSVLLGKLLVVGGRGVNMCARSLDARSAYLEFAGWPPT